MKKILLACLLLVSGLAARAAGPIVDAAFVAEAAKRGAIVWDVRDTNAYMKGHIPGAVNIDAAGMVLRNMNTEDFLPTAQVEKILGEGGIDPSKEVVVYGSRGNAVTYFALYALNYFGARTRSPSTTASRAGAPRATRSPRSARSSRPSSSPSRPTPPSP